MSLLAPGSGAGGGLHRRLTAVTCAVVVVSPGAAAGCSAHGVAAAAPTSSAVPSGPATSPAPSIPEPSIVATSPAQPSNSAPPPTQQATPQAPPSQLSTQQLAGQRVIYSYPGLTPPSGLLRLIREGRAAGVIFFGRNLAGPAQIGGAIAQLRQAQQQSPVHVPLLLMTDQEGGQVRRLPGEPALSEKQIGASADPQAAASQAGTGAGRNLAGVGMNVNLAPVLDVFYRPGDFIDQIQRSYGQAPAAAAGLGRSFIGAQQATGVAATAKHFPGLGSAAAGQNTDNVPVTLQVPLAQLRGTDEVPYQAAIAAGVKLVMVSWAVYPALDASRPAGLSPVVVQQELRGHLGYTGVTVTDALEAGALGSVGTSGQRAVASAGAGMDLLLCSSGSVSQGEDATTALAGALTSGRLSSSEFLAAFNRVTALRAGLR